MDGSAEDLERLAARAERAHEVVEARRAALGRYALVWWNGEAAERYWEHVEERRGQLATCAADLAELAALARRTAELVRGEGTVGHGLGGPG